MKNPVAGMKARCAVMVLVAVTAGILAAGSTAAAPAPVSAHWSQIVGNSQSAGDATALEVVARFIVDGAGEDCSAFKIVPQSAAVHPSPAGPIVERQGAPSPAFPITVCQFVMGVDWQSADLYAAGSTTPAARFPGPYPVGRQGAELVAVGLGDTGCRASDCKAAGGKNARFAQVIQEVLEQAPQPDFVFHVGDYRYYNENIEADAWWKWNTEFFQPAQPLLELAPIALARGNHEECDGQEGYWYGERWYQFFEPTTSAAVTPCPSGAAALHRPWAFDVALKASAAKPTLPHRIVMVDNSPDPKNFGCRHYSPSSPNAPTSSECVPYQQIVRQMAEGFAAALSLSDSFETSHSGSQPSVWWAMHKPVWSYPNKYASEGTEDALFTALGNPTHQPIANTLCSSGACVPNALMAGHAHMYQRSAFNGSLWPTQYVLGHSGVQPLSGTSTRRVYGYVPPVDYEGQFTATVDLVYNENGFLIFRRNAKSASLPAGWKVENCLLGKGCHKVSP